ncbi:glycosyltransferase [Nocardioides glacieisoli]|uniref:Glycosyltransferase n=1 Tax=Nocardioides glacieisoli TaxID=1168730 RepID=A0A4Q2RU02_9ACTN|nr:glycosyltransferase [Nocardioides glacieisoli]RYB92580.1 glycosyltransferase [Nocardioides glacieisoli]
MGNRVDVVMVTHRSAGYVHLSLPRVLETLGPDDRVWLWHNGDDEATLEAIRPYRADERIAQFHHSRDNVRLRPPTNWLWDGSDARFVAKVDDDCLVSPGWLDLFVAAHDDNPGFGVVGSWRHPDEEFRPDVAAAKIQEFNGGHSLMRNHWVQGSGYVMPRAVVTAHGLLGPQESFSSYCVRLARAGRVNGYYFPFVREEHMDDPRSAHTLIHDDRALLDRMPLSAAANGVTTVEQWTAQLERSALLLQTAPLDLRTYSGWRRRARSLRRRVRTATGRPRRW